MKVLITGATGFLGRYIIEECVNNNDSVTAVVRRRANFDSRIEQINIADIFKKPDLLKRFDAVIHAAGLAHGKRSVHSTDLASDMYATNTSLSYDLAKITFQNSNARFVLVSSIAVYGLDSSDEKISEESMLAPTSPYGQSKMDAEKAVSILASTYDGRYTIVRPPLIYGPDAPGNFGLLSRLAKTKLPLPFGLAHAEKSVIGVRNLASFLRLVAQHPNASNQVFLVADEEPSSLRLLTEGLREGDQRLFSVPISLLRAVFNLVGKGKIGQQLFASLPIDWSKAKVELNWKQEYNFKENMNRLKGGYLD